MIISSRQTGFRDKAMRIAVFLWIVIWAPAASAQSTLSTWQTQMVTKGTKVCQALQAAAADPARADEALAATYYDAIAVYRQIRAYTGSAQPWTGCEATAYDVYVTRYVRRADVNGGVPGYWIFTSGLRDRGDSVTVCLLANKAAYAAPTTPVPWTDSPERVREVAYGLLAYVNCKAMTGQVILQAAGGAPWQGKPRLPILQTQLKAHMRYLFTGSSWQGSTVQVSPFMAGLGASALIEANRMDPDPEIEPLLREVGDWLWTNAWLASARAMKYQINAGCGCGDPTAAPDLNQLIAPLYAWLWEQTGKVVHRDRAEQLFDGATAGAWLDGAKQYNQNYVRSFDTVKRLRFVPGIPAAPTGLKLKLP